MRKYIILVLLCVSCNLKPKKEDPCVTKIEYISQLDMLVPESAINVYIEDKEGFLQEKLAFKELKGVILYSIKEENREDFHSYPDLIPSKTDNNIVILKILTAYFHPNIYIKGVRRENKWTPEQIQKAIDGDIGFVFEKDTIRVKKCQK
ncbi:hypothetical protein QWY99_19875 [Flavobacterium branchiarum]|uniref:Lipoprotein n=1 Tax=Flavobacterium branchiarum TaxID=1114870 RepID=A0ABV5FG35_9FLAO|nr:hypothetical protein [Flavobacterium branchiarum]MDN3675295.1 hypothetical protein [Flavobacterium branchiarum]